MKNDFDLITYKFDNEIIIVPIGDIHIGNINFDLERWKKFKEKLLSTDNMYIVLVGDLIDNQTKNSHSPFSIAVIDGIAMTPFEQKKYLINELKDIKQKILCGVPGNHEAKKDNKATDQDIMYDVFCKLDIEDKYRPSMAFLKIQIGITHGSGGGTQTGSAVNKNEKFGYSFDGLDCIIVGHTHKPAITKPMKLVIDSKNDKISFKPFYHVIATSWLKYGGYALVGQLTPSSFMEQELTLKKDTNKKIEIKVG